jgi:hypothetical protein
MKLKEARSLAIKYCEENKCNYTYISHNNVEEFYLTDKEEKHTVFYINKNGSLNPCRSTQYAADFHKELKRRKKNRRKNGKKTVAYVANSDLVNED